MRGLAANLSIYYQCGWMWAIYVIVGLICLPLLVIPLVAPERSAARGLFSLALLVAYLVGYFVSVMQKETQVKPFTFCLPNHRLLGRRIVFGTGVAISLLLGLLFLRYPGLVSEQGWLAAGVVAWSAASIALSLYLLAAALAWRIANGAAFWALPIILTWRIFADVQRKVAEQLGEYTAAATLVMGVIAVLVWLYMHPARQARRLCGANYLAPHESLNRDKVDRFKRGSERRSQQSPLHDGLLAALFMTPMHRLPGASVRRYLWGESYAAVGRLFSESAWALLLYALLIVLLIVGLGYRPLSGGEGWVASANVIFLVPAIVGMAVIVPVFTPLLLPAGRRERMAAGILVGILGGAIAGILGIVCHLLSHIAGSSLPNLAFAGREFIYVATDLRYLYLPLVFLPLCYGCQLLFGRWAGIPQLVLIIVLGFWLVFGAASLRPEEPWRVTFVLLASWGFYFGLVRHYCRRADLVRL